MTIDLNLIFQKPLLDTKAKLTIIPLAPLSMVSDIPGSYYKTNDIPDKYKLCGLFENILGWHFDKNDRLAIHKKMKSERKKDFVSYESNSGFKPLLYNFFEKGMEVKYPSIRYNDLWKRSFSRMDADVHPKGTPNLDYEVLKLKHKALKETNIGTFFSEHKKKYPMYYTSPTLREYVAYEGEIQICLTIHQPLFIEIQNALKNNSTAYLGNSESWVEIKIELI